MASSTRAIAEWVHSEPCNRAVSRSHIPKIDTCKMMCLQKINWYQKALKEKLLHVDRLQQLCINSLEDFVLAWVMQVRQQ